MFILSSELPVERYAQGPGSCYLFNCGPPEDFRCKFTAHSNFSSGVLAISRPLAELQDQERLAHHEQELANLRYYISELPAGPAAPRAELVNLRYYISELQDQQRLAHHEQKLARANS